jgi:hypothetical protein
VELDPDEADPADLDRLAFATAAGYATADQTTAIRLPGLAA